MMKKINVLFVCLGNICRSPTAHGVFRHLIEAQGLQDRISVDSAGTSGWHIGEPPDKRATAAALARGYDLSDLRGRQLLKADFVSFDYILAMDEDNLSNIQQLSPPCYEGTLGLFLAFSSQSEYREVPDPYYGGNKGFETVLDLVENACSGLLSDIQRKHL